MQEKVLYVIGFSVADKLAALWPFLGIVGEVISKSIISTSIFIEVEFGTHGVVRKVAVSTPGIVILSFVSVLCTIIFIYEKRRSKPDFDDAEPNATEG